MPTFTVEVPHELDQEQAKRRLDQFVDMAKKKQGSMVTSVEATWAENVMTFVIKSMVGGMDGKITVEETKAVVVGNLPLAAMMFQGQIKKQFQDDLAKLLRS